MVQASGLGFVHRQRKAGSDQESSDFWFLISDFRRAAVLMSLHPGNAERSESWRLVSLSWPFAACGPRGPFGDGRGAGSSGG